MKIFKKQWWAFFILMLILLMFNIHSVNALDELFLTGVVKSINSHTGIAIVDVKSEVCRGFRSFRADDISELEGLEGERISFFINSLTCKGDKIYTMHKITLLKSKGKRP
jgi:hypothetical protein